MTTSIKQNLTTTDPDLGDLLDLHKKDIMLSLSAHHIGTIQSFNSANQTASATINYTKTYFDLDQASGSYMPVQVNYPLLMDCPCIVLGGGGGALTFPISAGDECLILFNDRSLDTWFQGNIGAAVSSPRLHSFSDGIILVGLRNSQKVLSSYDSSHASLRGSSGRVGVNVGTGKVLITAGGSSLGAALQQFCTTCEGSADDSLRIAATTLAAALGGLLE